MTAIIIDDEVYCTDVMKILLSKHCPEVQILAVFNHSTDALEFLHSHQPDIVFLDIEMPQINGFELLNRLDKINSKIIFTTAYDQYAIKAFKFNAVDYLLKPIDKNELISAVRRSSPILTSEHLIHFQHIRTHHTPERILLPIGNEIIFQQVNDIICCEAEGSYCKVYCIEKDKPFMLSKNLRDIEDLLNNPGFFRPHTSWLIQDKYISKIIKGEGMEIVLFGNIHVPVARTKKQEVMERLSR